MYGCRLFKPSSVLRGQCRRQHAIRGIGGLAPGAEEDAVEDAEEAPLEQGNAVVEPSPDGGGAAEFPTKMGHVLLFFLLVFNFCSFSVEIRKKKWKCLCMEWDGMASSATTSEPLSHENEKQGCELSHFLMRRGVFGIYLSLCILFYFS